MSNGRSIIPDLDALESPLLSPTPLTGLAGVPGSAIAEKIFNDPDSWDDTSGDEGDYPEDVDTLAWFTEEIEKLRRQSGGMLKDDFDLSLRVQRETKETDLVPKREGNAGWKDIARRGSVRPISLAGLFEQPNDEFSKEIQQHLSKILGSVDPRSSPYTTGSMSTPSTADSIATPLTSSISSEMSPSVYPASATLSFLEYYGIYPDSPLFDGRNLPRKKSVRKPPHSKDTQARFLRPARVPSPPPRLSSVPPPGLDLPFRPHPAPPGLVPHTDKASPSPSHSRKNSDLHEDIASFPSGPDSSPRSRPLPIATGVSSTPVSADASPVRVRRLPSIPSEPQPQVSSSPDQSVLGRTTPPPLPPKVNPPISAAFLSPPESSAVFPFISLGSAVTQVSTNVRTPITIRSPLGVPLGPRTRGRSSDAARQLPTIQPC